MLSCSILVETIKNNELLDLKTKHANLIKRVVALLTEYNSSSIHDIESYMVNAMLRILKMTNTFIGIVEESGDFQAIYSQVRMLADNIFSFITVYNCLMPEREFRHYLYILDGELQCYDLFEIMQPKRESFQSESNYLKAIEHCKRGKQKRGQVIAECITKLENNELTLQYPNETKELIESRNWKFNNIFSRKSVSWNKIYKKYAPKETAAYLSYLSQLVHGLGMSNYCLWPKEEDYITAITTVQKLLHFIELFIQNRLEYMFTPSVSEAYEKIAEK